MRKLHPSSWRQQNTTSLPLQPAPGSQPGPEQVSHVFEPTWPFQPTFPTPVLTPRDAGPALLAMPLRISSMLAAATVPTLVQQTQFHHLILPRQNRLLSSAPDTATLLHCLLHDPTRRTRTLNLLRGGDFNVGELRTNTCLSPMVWSVALREEPSARFQNAKAHYAFRILRWPSFGNLESNKQLIRLAALYSRCACTIERGSQTAGASPEVVAAFLSACEAAGIRVTGTDHGTANCHWPHPPLASGLQLQRMRVQLTPSESGSRLDR